MGRHVANTMQKQQEHLQLLYVVNDMLRQAEADGLNISVILPRILRVAAKELDASSGSIIIVDADSGVEYSWNVDGSDSYQTQYHPFIAQVMEHGIAGQAVRTHMTICIGNTLEDERWWRRPDHATAREPWSALCTPLITRQRAIGALTITKRGVAQFDSSDADLLRAIATQAASNIENARLYTTTQRQLREAELFNAASRAINSSLDVNEIMQSMLRQMNELLNAEAISVALVEGNELVYRLAEGAGKDEIVGLRLPRNQGITGWVMENAEPVLVNNPQQDNRFDKSGDQRSGQSTKAIICAPLEANDRVLGTIQAINPPDGNFLSDDLRVLVRLASLASSAIDKSDQYRKTQAAEARYTNLFEDSIDPIIITSLDGVIQEVNRRVRTFLQYERAELVGRSIDLLHRGEIFSEAHTALAENIGTIHVVQRRAITAGNGSIPVEVHVKRTRNGSHEELQWIYHDISKQVELEQMRDDLTAMLFHDMQNPLSNVISSLELLDDDLLPEDVDPIASMMVTVAYRSSQRLRHLIRSLLDINQLEAGHPIHEQRCVGVNEMFDFVSLMMEMPMQTKGMTLKTVAPDDLPPLMVNKDMIERVIINLVDNAVKFSKRDDVITLSAHLNSAKNFVEISLADQGPGIPAKYRRSIFEKFYRTPNNPSKGIGLGLAFCRLAVEAHGGGIWVTESASGGAQFNFSIPADRCV